MRSEPRQMSGCVSSCACCLHSPCRRTQPRPTETIRAELEVKGEVSGNNDLWIAAHAVASELTLVTNNEGEFLRVRGLKVQNWAR